MAPGSSRTSQTSATVLTLPAKAAAAFEATSAG